MQARSTDFSTVARLLAISGGHPNQAAFLAEMSDQASVQMDTTPASPPNAAAVMVSLWQTNRIGLLARAWFGAERIRPSAVAILTGVNWSA